MKPVLDGWLLKSVNKKLCEQECEQRNVSGDKVKLKMLEPN